MPNFKFIKRVSVLFVLAFVLFSHNISLAEERISARDSEMAVLIESAEIKTREEGSVKRIEIEAILSNPSSNTETPIATHLLILNSIDPLAVSKNLDYTPSPIIVSAQEGGEYFSLKPGERKAVRYFLPVSRFLPVANYALNFRLMRKDGEIVGQYREILRDFGFNQKKTGQNNYEKGFLAFFQESCVILNAKGEKFEPNEGPVFDSLERPKARCMVKNIGDEDITVSPKIEWKEFFVYGRPSSGVRAEEASDNILTFKKGETKLVEVFLPLAQKPQVYQALLSFENGNSAKMSFGMPFRWTIGGSSARAEKISLISPIKNVYEKGETMSLSVDYFGSMDLYWNNSSDESVGLSKIKILVIVKDNNNEICGENHFNLRDISDSERKNQIIDIVLDKKCESASYTVSIHSGEEKLAEETAEVPKITETKTNKIYYYAGALILFLTLFITIIKKRKKTIVPIAMLLFIFIAFGISFNSADASATKTYTGISYGGENYGGDAGDNSAPLYSFYGVNDTSNVNKLVIKKVEANLDTDLNGFYADIYYAAGFTSCSNSTMHIRFKMYIEANGLAKTQVKFAPAGSTNYQSKQIREYASIIYAADEELFDIDPSSLKNFYDSANKLKANPYLIIEIVQSGKSTHSNPYHRGDFSKPVSVTDYASRTDAFDASDTIIYKIPLNLPAPSADLSLSGTSPIAYNCKPTLSWTVNDVDSCSANGGWSESLDNSNGTHSQTMLTGIKTSTDYGLSCSKNLGDAIGDGTYTDSVTVRVKDMPTVDLKAKKWGDSTAPTASSFSNSLTINSGDSVTFHWGLNDWSYNSAGVNSCEFEGVNYTSGTQKTISNITSAKTYNITCKNSCGYSATDSVKVDCANCSSSSSATPLSGIPSQPQNFTASAACKAVNLSWNIDSKGEYNDPVGNTGSQVVKYYKITRDGSYTIEKSDNINRWNDASKKFVDDNNSYTDSSATDSTKTYSYTIKACNDQNKCSADAGPATATPTAGPCSTTPTTPTTPTSSTPSSSSSANPDWYNLTFKTSGSGSGNATRYNYDDTFGWTGSKTMSNGDTAGIGRDYKFKLVPNPSSGSYFSSWSGCGSVNSDNECLLEKNPYPGADKTVTATFNDSSGGCVGCGSSVKAYISARETVVTDGNSTVITWTSDNADSCEQKEGGNDTGWISAGDTASGSYTTANFTTSGGSRTYTIECFKGSQKSGDVSVTVDVGKGYTGSPSVTMWADPQSVGYKKTSAIQWLGSNVQGSCLLYSASDDMNGYLKDYGRAVVPSFGTGYYASVGSNNTTGQKTGKLASDTTYKIQCKGYGPSYTKVTAQTTVAAAKPVSNFTIANSSGASLVATIVEGLSANSNNIALSLSGEAIGNISLSASIPAISGARVQFLPDDGITTTWSDTLSVDISAISQVKIRAIKIPGATPAGIYNVAITATDTGTGGKTKKLNVNLRVDRVSSEWEEF